MVHYAGTPAAFTSDFALLTNDGVVRGLGRFSYSDLQPCTRRHRGVTAAARGALDVGATRISVPAPGRTRQRQIGEVSPARRAL